MSTINSPNMSLPVPIVGVEVGPAWATDLNVCLSTLDAHNHAPGSGVQINPAGLNINADLSFGSNNATLLRSTRFASQGAAFSLAADRACLYVVGNELYYSDGAGNQVPITASGSVNAGAGSITGLPSGTASVVYASATFTFNSATSTRATIDVGPIIIRNTTASSFGITLSPPTLSSNYSLVLPALPASTSFMQLDNSGNITTSAGVDNVTLQSTSGVMSIKNNGVTATQIANGAITTTQINSAAAIVGTQLSASANIVGTQLTNNTIGYQQLAAANSVVGTIPNGSYANGVRLAQVSLTTNSRPVMFQIFFTANTAAFAASSSGVLEFRDGATPFAYAVPNPSGVTTFQISPGTSAHTYGVYWNDLGSGSTVSIAGTGQLYAQETK